MKFLFASLLLLVALPLHGAPEDAERKQEELEALRDEIRDLQQQIARDIGQRDELTAGLRETERELGRAANALREVNITLDFKQQRLDKLKAEQRARRGALAAEREALAGQVRAAYMAGREEKMKLLLNQQDPATFGRVLAYYDYFNRARVRRIDHVNEQLARLAVLKTEIDREVAALTGAREKRAAILDGLERTRDERAQLLAKLETRIRSRNAELEQLRADERALSELVASLLDVFADIPSQLANRAAFGELRGKLPWPAAGSVVARFGEPRVGGRMQWNGLMIAGEPGTPVRAVSHGRVAYADWLPHYGLLMVIEHGDGYLSLYGHNQALYKEVGDWVEGGEIIAAIGDSGGQQRAALYFEIRHGKEVVNPGRWLE
ncbi:MAG TPA: peptidoglycan DD-metalloendopeptidase family protein [Gammaproteobacteria bacterium]